MIFLFVSAPISCVLFDSAGKYILTAGDKHVRVLHNVPGYYATIEDAKLKLQGAGTSAMRDRMNAQIKEAKAFLKSLGEES